MKTCNKKQFWIIHVLLWILVMCFMYLEARQWYFQPKTIQINNYHEKNIMKTTTEENQTNDRFKLFERRSKLVHQSCEKLHKNISKHHTSSWIKTDPVHLIYYCYIAKTGSTFWKRVLTVLSSNGTIKTPFEITLKDAHNSILSFSSMDLSKKLREGGQSFMFVRDPFERLFSAYVNKIYSPNLLFWANLNTEIIQTIRNSSSSTKPLTYGYDVTFPEFIKYVLFRNEHNERLDNHYKPMFRICDPCTTNYSYIGHLETFVDDATYILSKWRQEFDDVTLRFNNLPVEAAVDTARSRVRNLFELKNITSEIKFPFIKLILRTWREMQIRGYISKKTEFPFKGDVTHVTPDDVMKAIRNALDEKHNKTHTKMQRQEALMEAYRQVSLKDMELLREYVLIDCLLFGYDDRPSILFDRSKPIYNKFLYLDGLSA